MKNKLVQVSYIILIVLITHVIAYKMVHIPNRLEMVIIITVLLFYPILRKPIIGLYAIFILSPFIPYIRRLYYLIYERPKIDPLIIIGETFLISILLGLFFEFKKKNNSNVNKFYKIIIIYFIYLLIRTFFFNFLPITQSLSKFKFYGPPVLFFLVGTLYARQKKHLKMFWYITIAIGVLAAFYGTNQLYKGYSRAEIIWFSSIEFTTLFIGDIARPFSIFQAPVAFADYAQLAIIAVLMAMAWTKNRLAKFLILFIPMLFYAALITSVRSSWIGILVTFFIWYVVFNMKGNKNRVFAISGTIILFVGYQFIQESFNAGLNLQNIIPILSGSSDSEKYFNLLVANRTSALYNPLQEYSFLSRVMLWKQIFAESRDPILAVLGRGLGTLKADSLYMTYLAEFGYPGVVFISAIILTFILKGLTVIDTSTDLETVILAKGITTMNIIFALVSVTGTHIHYFPGDVYFWFWNGILIQLSITAEQIKNVDRI